MGSPPKGDMESKIDMGSFPKSDTESSPKSDRRCSPKNKELLRDPLVSGTGSALIELLELNPRLLLYTPAADMGVLERGLVRRC
jgi:hypothetical protein